MIISNPINSWRFARHFPQQVRHIKQGRQDLEFCPPAHLSKKELKELKVRAQEIEKYNAKILKARQLLLKNSKESHSTSSKE